MNLLIIGFVLAVMFGMIIGSGIMYLRMKNDYAEGVEIGINVNNMISNQKLESDFTRNMKDYIELVNDIYSEAMNELVEKIDELYVAFKMDAAAQIEKGNKTAGTRARKASLEIEKLLKEFRKASLEASK